MICACVAASGWGYFFRSKLICSRVKVSRYDIPSISGSTVDSDETEEGRFPRDVCLCFVYGPSVSKIGDGGRDEPLGLDSFELVV